MGTEGSECPHPCEKGATQELPITSRNCQTHLEGHDGDTKVTTRTDWNRQNLACLLSSGLSKTSQDLYYFSHHLIRVWRILPLKGQRFLPWKLLLFESIQQKPTAPPQISPQKLRGPGQALLPFLASVSLSERCRWKRISISQSH